MCVCVWIVVHTQKHMLERHMAELSTQLQHAFEPIFSNCKKLETFALRNFGKVFILYIYIYIHNHNISPREDEPTVRRKKKTIRSQ